MKDAKPALIVCVRVVPGVQPAVPGSIFAPCCDCASVLWISPASERLRVSKGALPICPECIVKRNPTDVGELCGPTPEQMDELTEHGPADVAGGYHLASVMQEALPKGWHFFLLVMPDEDIALCLSNVAAPPHMFARVLAWVEAQDPALRAAAEEILAKAKASTKHKTNPDLN